MIAGISESMDSASVDAVVYAGITLSVHARFTPSESLIFGISNFIVGEYATLDPLTFGIILHSQFAVPSLSVAALTCGSKDNL